MMAALLLGSGQPRLEIPTLSGTSVTLYTDGTTSVGPNWYSPTTGGVGSGYWYRATKTSGPSNFSPSAGTWYSLGIARTISATGGPGACNGVLELATDAFGNNVVASGLITVNNAT